MDRTGKEIECYEQNWRGNRMLWIELARKKSAMDRTGQEIECYGQNWLGNRVLWIERARKKSAMDRTGWERKRLTDRNNQKTEHF